MEFAARCAWVFLWLVVLLLAVVLARGSGVIMTALMIGIAIAVRYAWRLRQNLRSPASR
jgi:hypothetical protein